MKYQGFYDYALGDDGKPDRTFTAQQFCKHLSAIFGNGIVITNATGNDAWRVEKITDLKIKIKLGNNNFNFASLRGNPFAVDEEINIELSQGTDRWDAIMIRADATSTVRATDIKVTENSIALTRTDTIYDLRLARVHVVNNVITEVIDDRLNNDYCGIAAGLATINADDILNSIKSELESIESGAAVALKNGILQTNLNSEMISGKKINGLLNIINPIGKVSYFSHKINNEKYLLCDGSLIKSEDYPGMVSKLEKKYNKLKSGTLIEGAGTSMGAIRYSKSLKCFITWTGKIIKFAKDNDNIETINVGVNVSQHRLVSRDSCGNIYFVKSTNEGGSGYADYLFKFDISTNTKTTIGLANVSDSKIYNYLECINDIVYTISMDTTDTSAYVYPYNVADETRPTLKLTSTKTFIDYCVYKNKLYFYTQKKCFIVNGSSYETKDINLPISAFKIVATENEMFLLDTTNAGNNYKSSDGINFVKCFSGIKLTSSDGNSSLVSSGAQSGSNLTSDGCLIDLTDLFRRTVIDNFELSSASGVVKKENGNILIYSSKNNYVEYKPSDYLILPNIIGVINSKVRETEDYTNAESNYVYPYIKVLEESEV